MARGSLGAAQGHDREDCGHRRDLRLQGTASAEPGQQASPCITTRMRRLTRRLTRLGPSPSLTLLSLDRSQAPPLPPGLVTVHGAHPASTCGVGPIPVASSGLHSRGQGPAHLSPLPAPAHRVQGLRARCSAPGDSLRAGQAPAAHGARDEPGPLLQETRGRLGEHRARGWPALSCGLFPTPGRPAQGWVHALCPPTGPGGSLLPRVPVATVEAHLAVYFKPQKWGEKGDWLPRDCLHGDVQTPPQNAGGEPCPWLLSPLHPSPTRGTQRPTGCTCRGPSTAHSTRVTSAHPRSRLRLGAFLLSLRHLWKFPRLPRRALPPPPGRLLGLAPPVSPALHSGTPWLVSLSP